MHKEGMTRYILPILAGFGLILGIIMVFFSLRTPPAPPIPYPPPISPYVHAVAGVGLVEASTENIEIGTPFTEIVKKVFVQSGDFVEGGDPLFELETQSFEAELVEAQANWELANANYQKQLDLPRPEDVPIYEALVGQANVNYLDKFDAYEIVQNVKIPKAVSTDERNVRMHDAEAAKYKLDEAKDRLALLNAGAWIADLEIFRADRNKAKALMGVVQDKIDRSTVRAPFAGLVLQVKIRVGETAEATQLSVYSLMLFGKVDPLHLRIDIDEEDAWRVIKGAPGRAFVRGNSSITVDLEFVKINPYLIPKHYLTGDTDERVDTRVLELIYSFNRGDLPIYPGQIMDVFVEAEPNIGTP